jgi:cytochrome c oxidase subunit 4
MSELIANKAAPADTVEGQQHPISIYFWIWGLLFVLSACSYFVDYIQLQGFWRWTLILIFMFLKAGLIVAFFMHMIWERLALVYAILVPPLVIGVLILLMALEADYIYATRDAFFSAWNNFFQISVLSH